MAFKRCFLLRLTGFIVLLAFAPSAFAQGTSGLKIRVVDKDGAPLPSARVTVTNSTLGISQAAVTDADGSARIVPLPPGKGYNIEIAFPQMSTIVQSDIELTVNKLSTMTFTLRPDTEMKESIRVTAMREVVDTSKTSSDTTFSSEFIDALPILGRNYQDVLTLAPGVQDTDGDGNPNIHGARDTDVNTLVDGVSTVDPLTGLVGQQLNLESIQEIEVKTTGASAEFSRGQGGFVNIVTKSGGNDFEGSFRVDFRTFLLDGDGAGIRDPSLTGGLGELGLRDLEFTSYTPFVAVSGPILRDKAWYFFTAEVRHEETPVNALTQAFIQTTEEERLFGKLSWDVSTNHKLVFTATSDPQTFENVGVTSFIPIESGWTREAGGTNLVLKETSILSPNLFLETTLQSFASQPAIIPTTSADTNGNNGRPDLIDGLFIDRNNDGFFDATERDPGEDYDRDGRFDVFEDANGNGQVDGQDLNGDMMKQCGQPSGNGQNVESEDRDCDGRVTLAPKTGQIRQSCEGRNREDLDCDGHLDRIDEDPNGNRQCDPGEPCDIDSDGRFDRGIEDRNGSGRLDDRPFPDPADPRNPYCHNPMTLPPGVASSTAAALAGYPCDVLLALPPNVTSALYPYGSTTPETFDEDLTFDQRTQRTFGPWTETQDAETGRLTLRSDLTMFIPDWHGQHDMKMGGKVEFEHFDQTLYQRPQIFDNLQPVSVQIFDQTLGVNLPSQYINANSAENTTIAFYVQDTFKPMPNLTLNLGVRFDREAIDTFGYTSFDPAAQRDTFDRLLYLNGYETRVAKNDLENGNNDGFLSSGFCGDPIFDAASNAGNACIYAMQDSSKAWQKFLANPVSKNPDDGPPGIQAVASLALTRLTQHHFGTTLVAKELEALFPEAIMIDPATGDKVIDRDILREQGAVFQEQESFRITNNNLAPRLAVSWDPWSDSKTKVYATWSRFYDKLFLNAVVGEEGPDAIYRYYFRDEDGITATGVPNATVGDTISKAPPNFTQVDRGLRTPYTDEWTVGFERELAPEVSLRLTYIDRQSLDGLQDKDINHEVRCCDPTTGKMLDSFGNLNIPPGSTVGTPAPDRRPDLFINNFFFNQILRIGNFNEARYKAFELQLTKRLSRKWQMDGSYTYARALGDAEDFESALGDDPSTAAYEYGPLNFDQRHTVRLNAVTFLPGDWQLGTTMEWNSGLPFTTVTTGLALDNYQFPQFRTLFGSVPLNPNFVDPATKALRKIFEPENRNSRRNDSWYNINLNATKSFVMGRLNSKLFLAIDNLLNSDDLTITFYNPAQSNTNNQLELVSTRQFGRRYQIGFQIEF
jgi:hypothetical protein